MLYLSLVTLGLATIGAYAKPMIRAVGGLEIFLSTPADKVAFLSDLRVVSTVGNVGYEDLKILKLGTVLDNEHPTHAFTVTKDGKEVPFNATRVTPPSDHLSENDWVVIPAGENVTSEHDVSALYDFSGSGLGTFIFDPVSRFQVIGVNDTVYTTSGATPIVIANAHSVSITITGCDSKRELKLEKRLTNNCAGNERYFVKDSVTEALSMAATALTYIKGRHANDELFKYYFGANSEKTVTDRFNLILNADSSKFRKGLFCFNEGNGCKKTKFAYSIDEGIVYCSPFYSQKGVKGIKDFCQDTSYYVYRGGTTLRMLATLLFPSTDSQMECYKAIALPDDQKLSSARNYECFAMGAIRRTWCK